MQLKSLCPFDFYLFTPRGPGPPDLGPTVGTACPTQSQDQCRWQPEVEWCLGEPVLLLQTDGSILQWSHARHVWVGTLGTVLSQSTHCHIAHHQTPPAQPSGKNLGIEVTLQFLPKEGCTTQTARGTRCCPKQRGGNEAAMPQLGECSGLCAYSTWPLPAHQ